MSTTNGRPGRAGSTDGNNRARILAAARDEFAAKGLTGATMRSIASRAGFDVALVAHYFGNKGGLFMATIELPDGASTLVADALSGPLETQGERLTRAYLGLWEHPDTGAQMRVLARSAVSSPVALARVEGLLTGLTSSAQVGQLIAGRELGFVFAMAHLLGVATVRYLTVDSPLQHLEFESVVTLTAPAVQLQLGRTSGD